MNPPSETTAALAALLARVRETRATVAERFPLFADPATGRWTTTRRGSWTGGYWVGLLWLAAHIERRDEDRFAAPRWTSRLRAGAATDTVTRGMTFWYGAAIGDLLAGDAAARDVALAGARSVAGAYVSELRIVPTGDGLGAGVPAATIDGVVGLVPLLVWAAQHGGDARLREVASCHAARHVELCLRADGSIRAHADPRGDRPGPDGAPPRWARGQAWGMLALTQAAQWLPGDYISVATRAADWWLRHAAPASVTPWDFDDPAGPADSSAAAIAAVALLRLAELTGHGGARYRCAALDTIATLTSRHLTPLTAADARPRGILLDGCYDRPSQTATRHELVWGSFFLVQALAIAAGLLEPCAL